MVDIVVNGRFSLRRISGVERYGAETVRRLGNRVRVVRSGRNLQGLAGHLWEQIVLPRLVHPRERLWSPANTGPMMIRRQALTIQDLIPLEHPEWYRKNFASWYRLFLPILAKRVRKVFVPSEYIKRKMKTCFGIENVVITPAGVDTGVFHPGTPRPDYDLPDCYILFVGSLEPRKNLPLLLDAWNEIQDDFTDTWLIIAGTTGSVFRTMTLPNRMERVRFLGYVPDTTLPGLYAGADLFVLPSLDEGFGLPALEAMACGIPVIVSDGGALSEVVGEAGLIFKLSESGGLPQAMIRCLSDRSLRSALKEKGLARARMFSWQDSAEIIWQNLNEI